MEALIVMIIALIFGQAFGLWVEKTSNKNEEEPDYCYYEDGAPE